jgi:cyclohexadienyl dehydratase
MRHRAVTALGVLAVAVLLAVSGCAKKPEPLVAAPPPSTLDLVNRHGELRVCSTGDARPFSVRDPGGRWSGTDVDLAGDLAAQLGVRLALVPTTWTTMLDDLGGGSCDLVMSGVSVTLGRAARAFVSQPYLTDTKAAVVRCSDTARFGLLDQIDRPGVRAAVTPGGSSETFARDRLHAATVTSFPDIGAADQGIATSRADVLITDSAVAREQARLHPGQLCVPNPDRPIAADQKAYLLPRGDVVFQQYVDLWIKQALLEGTFRRASQPPADGLTAAPSLTAAPR